MVLHLVGIGAAIGAGGYVDVAPGLLKYGCEDEAAVESAGSGDDMDAILDRDGFGGEIGGEFVLIA